MTKNEIFNQVLQELKESRTQKIIESKNKLKSLEVYNGVLPLRNKLGELKIEKAKAELNSLPTTEIENKIKQCKLDLIFLLKQYNINTSKLNPNFSCKTCNDTGFVNSKACDCLILKYKNRLLDLTETNLTAYPTLDKINTTVYSNKNDVDAFLDILTKNYNIKKFNTIVFSGETGTGKTFIAKSLLKTYVLNENTGLFIPSFNLNNELLSYHTNFDSNKNLDKFLSPNILVIDDLGTENIYKNVTIEYLLYILNERQQNNKITIFSTNLTFNDIKIRYTEKFCSRLFDKNISLTFQFKGKDVRLD